ncbi:zona pellucida sperm-binding protein 4-like [Coregonus clupeaformis]|uniref:zona pellucida sperm-binding protein 4-like n=1 Tax=Coregonus clupeaformis TaxID=59861 RepID=UPI001E1C9AFE|nr:zona pellucida sperm-binding protein 4-like [Coregonus clupeaformis]
MQYKDYPVIKVLREPVFTEVHILGRTDTNLVLILRHCWVTSTPSLNSVPWWDLLVDGCPYRDDQYLTALVPVHGSSGLQNPTHYKCFSIKMFTFVDAASIAPLKEKVFIHCSTEVCRPSATESCEQRCNRQRRDVSAAQKILNGNGIVVSSGEVILIGTDLSVSDLGIGQSDGEVPQSLNYSLLKVAGSTMLVVFVLVLAMIWRSKPSAIRI